MKKTPPDGSREPDAVIDRFFEIRDLAPDDFTNRTFAAVQAKARRDRVIRRTAWSLAAAATFAVIAGLRFSQPAAEGPELAASGAADYGGQRAPSATAQPEASLAYAYAAAAETEVAGVPPTVEELTLALHAAVDGRDAIFYGGAVALEQLLSDAVLLTEGENSETLDFLILLAEN